MSKAVEIAVGTRFGLWVVTGPPMRDERGRRLFPCRCDCGTERPVMGADLRSGKSTNCRCRALELSIAATRHANTTHGMEGSTEYRVWVDMRRRCHQPHRPDFRNYGARGITVCEEWRTSFEAFYRDMGPRPDGCTLDRIDNGGPYCKANCRWAPLSAQKYNRRNTRRLDLGDGRVVTVAEAMALSGLGGATIRNRIHLGWTDREVVLTPLVTAETRRGKKRGKYKSRERAA